jgi:hypothetical protein
MHTAGALVFVLAMTAFGCGRQRDTTGHEHVEGAKPVAEVQEPLRSEIIEQATKLARERGLSVDGLSPWVTDRGSSWRVSFSGGAEKRMAGGQGFTVKIAKDGKAPPEVLRFQ